MANPLTPEHRKYLESAARRCSEAAEIIAKAEACGQDMSESKEVCRQLHEKAMAYLRQFFPMGEQ